MGKLVAEIYAEALFLLAKEKQNLEKIYLDYSDFFTAIKNEDKYLNLLNSPVITDAEKKDLLNEFLKNDFCAEFRNFLFLLIDKKRISSVNDAFLSFEEKYRKEKGIDLAVINSAKKLSEKELNSIKEKLEKISGKTLEIKNKIDSSLIGGFVAELSGKEIDLSVSSTLENIRLSLLKSEDMNKIGVIDEA